MRERQISGNEALMARSCEERGVSWCPEPDSNRHTFRRRILSAMCLPISPSGRDVKQAIRHENHAEINGLDAGKECEGGIEDQFY